MCMYTIIYTTPFLGPPGHSMYIRLAIGAHQDRTNHSGKNLQWKVTSEPCRPYSLTELLGENHVFDKEKHIFCVEACISRVWNDWVRGYKCIYIIYMHIILCILLSIYITLLDFIGREELEKWKTLQTQSTWISEKTFYLGFQTPSPSEEVSLFTPKPSLQQTNSLLAG